MTRKEFAQIGWDAATIDDCRQIIRLAVREDLARGYDLTTLAIVSENTEGAARLVSRAPGVCAGLRAAELVLRETNSAVQLEVLVEEGQTLAAGQALGVLSGKTRDILTMERVTLNLLGRLSGIATLTRRYVDAAAGTGVRIYDTRKTTPGWRRLEKYAVRCGGGCNHRTGLFDAVLIKDNHLAQGSCGVTEAILAVKRFLAAQPEPMLDTTIVEVEVDTLEQLDEALRLDPDIVLLDNMTCERLRHAVKRRNEIAPRIELEASGGVHLDTIRTVAETGVDRISIGALTHSATSLDIGLDWRA